MEQGTQGEENLMTKLHVTTMEFSKRIDILHLSQHN